MHSEFFFFKYKLYLFYCMVLIYCTLNTTSVGQLMSLLVNTGPKHPVNIRFKRGLTDCAMLTKKVILSHSKLLMLSIPEQASSICSSFLHSWWVVFQTSQLKIKLFCIYFFCFNIESFKDFIPKREVINLCHGKYFLYSIFLNSFFVLLSTTPSPDMDCLFKNSLHHILFY